MQYQKPIHKLIAALPFKSLNKPPEIELYSSTDSGVTKVVVTQCGNCWCHLFTSKSDDLFSSR